MISAVDTNVLIDIFRDDPVFCRPSIGALRSGIQEGRLVVCDIVWAELAAIFPSIEMLEQKMDFLGVEFVPMNRQASSMAGKLWKEYRARGGKRQRVVADFLIAAHASVQCDSLITRDRGFYRIYFQELRIIDPTRIA